MDPSQLALRPPRFPTDVLHSPAGSLLAVDWAGRELLVPFRREVVPTVDLARRVAVIDPPEGLLDL